MVKFLKKRKVSEDVLRLEREDRIEGERGRKERGWGVERERGPESERTGIEREVADTEGWRESRKKEGRRERGSEGERGSERERAGSLPLSGPTSFSGPLSLFRSLSGPLSQHVFFFRNFTTFEIHVQVNEISRSHK